MALRIRCWKTAGLRILLITSFFGFTCGILIYFIKNRSVYDGAGGKAPFRPGERGKNHTLNSAKTDGCQYPDEPCENGANSSFENDTIYNPQTPHQYKHFNRGYTNSTDNERRVLSLVEDSNRNENCPYPDMPCVVNGSYQNDTIYNPDTSHAYKQFNRGPSGGAATRNIDDVPLLPYVQEWDYYK